MPNDTNYDEKHQRLIFFINVFGFIYYLLPKIGKRVIVSDASLMLIREYINRAVANRGLPIKEEKG